MCVESVVSNIAGKPSEPLHVELTDEVLTYLRGVMLQQMSEQVKLRSHPRASHVEHVDLSDVPGVSWSSARTRYRAVHIDGKGAQTTHYTKNLDEAIKFTKDGIKTRRSRSARSMAMMMLLPNMMQTMAMIHIPMSMVRTKRSMIEHVITMIKAATRSSIVVLGFV